MRSFSLLLSLVLASLMLLGCEQIQEAMENAQQGTLAPGAPGAPGQPIKSPAEIETEKLNGYVDCFNRTHKRTTESAQRYYSYVPREEGPDCDKHKGDLYTLYEDSVALCNDAAAKGAKTNPKWPELDAAAQELAAANAAIVPLVKKANDYWEQEDYKDDKCEGGKAMHTELVAGFDRFQNALDAFSKALRVIKDESDKKALEMVKKRHGENIEYLHRGFLLLSRELINLLPEPQVPIDKETYIATYTRLETDYKALEEYAKNNAAEIQEVVFMGSGFEDYCKDYYKSAKFLKRELDEEKPDEAKLNELMDDMIQEYNDMIDASNRLSYQYKH